MNSQATSVTAWMRHPSEIAASLVYLREIGRTAFWEFCNTIRGKADLAFARVQVRQCPICKWGDGFAVINAPRSPAQN
jgi:hypothetical protein